ncbi:MAG: bile acid:sodium symporter family protein [Novosphingobium sp.]
MKSRLTSLLPDRFLIVLLATIALAIFLPVSGEPAAKLKQVGSVGIALLFFLYGARLHYSAVLRGLANWRLQLAALLATFAFFPLIAWPMMKGAEALGLVDPLLLSGFLFLSLLPSTVQSSIAMVGIARGNVAGAICCASFSNLAGVFLTPLFAFVLMGRHAGDLDPGAAIGKVAMQILLPFVLGMAFQAPLAGLMKSVGRWLKLYDRGVILLLGYMAISAAVTGGVFSEVGVTDLLFIGAMFALLLALATGGSWLLGGWLGLDLEDQVALLFCGSQKSLASGVPLAAALFPATMAGVIIVPVIIYHQMQLVIGTLLCGTMARRQDDGEWARKRALSKG